MPAAPRRVARRDLPPGDCTVPRAALRFGGPHPLQEESMVGARSSRRTHGTSGLAAAPIIAIILGPALVLAGGCARGPAPRAPAAAAAEDASAAHRYYP